jgi:hypothetical protein
MTLVTMLPDAQDTGLLTRFESNLPLLKTNNGKPILLSEKSNG